MAFADAGESAVRPEPQCSRAGETYNRFGCQHADELSAGGVVFANARHRLSSV